MVTHTNYRNLIDRLLGGHPAHQMAARMILIALQEDAVEAIADAFYAGVSLEQGQILLQLLADIGGYEALNILRDVVRHDKDRPQMRLVAAQGLLQNEQVLSEREVESLQRFSRKVHSWLEKQN